MPPRQCLPEISTFEWTCFRGGLHTLYLHTDALDALHERIRPLVTQVKAPHVTVYGMREWYIQDPDGYVVCLGQQA